MSLTVIAITGILVGFLCLVVGFFMEEGCGHDVTTVMKEKPVRRGRRRGLGQHHRKAA